MKKPRKKELKLRVPEHIHREIVAAARKHGNSLNNEICDRLRASIFFDSLGGMDAHLDRIEKALAATR